MEKATFGAGCFWGVEAEFRQVPGVVDTRVGYTGGEYVNPSYEDVCGGFTGHTEAVEVTYDPAKITFAQLLDVFWSIHQPTLAHKAQYKSVVFYHSEEQRAAAEAAKDALLHAGRKIATEILPATTFYPAEEYHQRYYEKTGQRACG